jgi:hypothetical protein
MCVLATAGVLTTASVASRNQTGLSNAGSLPKACSSAFPSASSTKIGETTLYNRQASVQKVLCFGFGLSASAGNTGFRVTPGMVCGILSQVIGEKWDTTGLEVDGACSGAALVLEPGVETDVSVACGWAADLLGVPLKAAGAVAGLACTVAPSAGHWLGSWAESSHESDVAKDIIQHGKCLKYSPSHFGSPWLAVACSASDPGFSNLPSATATSGGGGSSTQAGSSTSLQPFKLPTDIGAALRSFNGNAMVPGFIPLTWAAARVALCANDPPSADSYFLWFFGPGFGCSQERNQASTVGILWADTMPISRCPQWSRTCGLCREIYFRCSTHSIDGQTYDIIEEVVHVNPLVWLVHWHRCGANFLLTDDTNTSFDTLEKVLAGFVPLNPARRCSP